MIGFLEHKYIPEVVYILCTISYFKACTDTLHWFWLLAGDFELYCIVISVRYEDFVDIVLQAQGK